MSFLDTISVNDKNTTPDGKYTIIKGVENKNLKGFIYETESSKLVSASFGNAHVSKFSEAEYSKIISENSEEQTITICYEGPLVKVWFDEQGYHFSTSSNVYANNSFWGNKHEKFEKIFCEYGGDKFIQSLGPEPTKNLTHHFMVMGKNFTVTTRIHFRDNEYFVVYLGSVSIDGNINHPQHLDPNVYCYHRLDGINFLPTAFEINKRILIPSRMTPEEGLYILKNGYIKNKLSGNIHQDITCGECLIVRSKNKIFKITPRNYDLRCEMMGYVPNIKNQLYRVLELAKDIEQYKEKIPFVGCLDPSQIEIIKVSDKSETTFVVDTFLNSNKGFTQKNFQHRLDNIMSVMLLTCPLTKIEKLIEGWRDYLNCREMIIKFVKVNNGKIREGHYDSKLSEFHEKALKRIKDMALHSKNYANETKNGHTYISKLEFSIRGLVTKEFGPSLYRIEKAINFLKTN